MKTFSVKLFLVSGLLAGFLALIGTSIANAEKNEVNFDLQPGNLTKPAGLGDC